jgi:hypothetical protein
VVDVEVLQRLDRIVAILQLAFHEPIEAAKATIRADPVYAALLDACADDWRPAGQLQSEVSKATGKNIRTIQRRIADLVDRKALDQRGGGRTVDYKASGLL